RAESSPSFVRRAAVGAGCALVPPALWMLHGAIAHGSPLFFLHRVAAYRTALGGRESVLGSLTAYPAALIRTEPEIVLGAAAAMVLRRGRLRRFVRPATVLVAVLAFLTVGRLVGGAPTHHDERPLLVVFWGLAVVVGATVFGEHGRSADWRTLAVL